MSLKEINRLISTEGFRRRLFVAGVVIDRLTDEEKEIWVRWEDLRREFDEKFGVPQTPEMESSFMDKMKEKDPEGYRILSKVSRQEDEILESGQG